MTVGCKLCGGKPRFFPTRHNYQVIGRGAVTAICSKCEKIEVTGVTDAYASYAELIKSARENWNKVNGVEE